MSERNLEHFCLKIDKSVSGTLALLKMTYGEHAMKKSSVFERHGQFKEGQEDVHDVARSRQPKKQKSNADGDRV